MADSKGRAAADEGAPTAASDFRVYVQELEAEGDLVRITSEVDAQLELGAIVRKAYETESKAPLFSNIRGRDSKTGLFNVLGAPVGMSGQPGKRLMRLAKSLGLGSRASGQHIIERIVDASSKAAVACREVESGPVKEHRMVGDAVDLTQLPVPLLHAHDGGKYLQTFGMVVVQSPDGAWVNWSVTRAMVLGRRQLVGPIMAEQDIGAVRAMWLKEGKDMPFAMCFGVPPAAILVGGMPLPRGANEADYVGALTGRPVAVTRCETNQLCVPANAELVLEGVVSATETAPEGPMAEYHGLLFPADRKPQPVYRVDAMTFRHDPIVPLCVAGRAVDENHSVWGVMQAAAVLDVCRTADLPIHAAWCPFESHCMWMVLQADAPRLRQMPIAMPDFCNALGHCVFASKPGFYIAKLYLVGPDIDPTNLRDVIWAEATRCQPGANEFLFDQYPSIPLIPYVSHGLPPDAEHHYHNKVVRCCMFPSEFDPEPDQPLYEEGSFRASYPKHIQDRVNQRWAEYGY
ncbi:hypothetical protein CDD81_3400 [Ophiocordyceps australis]|uniref:Ferulic acid decarboxylase 1 n=1 Tax=Ophiocordyceps australis TaxID=1399860 RepID=A0A2C5XE49_9HYPO|nr:hypothetical protein CDD81_3400 [Ophiocordyceps australis]